MDFSLQQWGASQTRVYLDGLEARGQLLADNPELGTPREALAEGLLSFPFESHILFYLRQAHGIVIVRVLHHRMDPMRHL